MPNVKEIEQILIATFAIWLFPSESAINTHEINHK